MLVKKITRNCTVLAAAGILLASCSSPSGGSSNNGGFNPNGNYGPGGNGNGNGNFSGQTEILNTTWIFEKLDSEVADCTNKKNHASSQSHGGSDNDCDTDSKVKISSTPKTENVNKVETQFYLHFDADGGCYFGTIEREVSYIKTYNEVVYQVTTTCSKGISSHEGSYTSTVEENVSKKDVREGEKIYKPVANGSVEKADIKYLLKFQNELTFVMDNKASQEIQVWMNGNSNSNVQLLFHLYLSDQRGNPIELEIEKKGSTLKLVYENEKTSCGTTLNDGSQCDGEISNKSFTKWNKTDFKSDMTGPLNFSKKVFDTMVSKYWYFLKNNDTGDSLDYVNTDRDLPEGTITDCLKFVDYNKVMVIKDAKHIGANFFTSNAENEYERKWTTTGTSERPRILIENKNGYDSYDVYMNNGQTTAFGDINTSYNEAFNYQNNFIYINRQVSGVIQARWVEQLLNVLDLKQEMKMKICRNIKFLSQVLFIVWKLM